MTDIGTTFTGRRRDSKDRLSFVYRMDVGGLLVFAKAVGNTKWATIGSRITLEAVDGTSYRVTDWTQYRQTSLGNLTEAELAGRPTDEEVKAWRSEEAADVITVEAIKVNKALRKDDRDIGDMTVKELAEMSVSWLPDRRAALVASVIARMNRG